MILITKTSDQTRQLYVCMYVEPMYVCMYVCIYVCMYVCMYVFMYVYIFTTYSKSMDQPTKVANPARGQLNRENEYFPVPVRASELVSRDRFSSPVPRQPAHLYTQVESGAYLRDSSRFPRRHPLIYLNRHTPSGRCRVYRVTQLRTDGVPCRDSAGTGPVNLKVVNGCCLGRSSCVCVCVRFLPIHSGHQVRWTYQPGSHRRKVTQDFSSTFFLRCVP